MSHIFWRIVALCAILFSTIPAHAQAPSCTAACQAKTRLVYSCMFLRSQLSSPGRTVCKAMRK